MKIKIFFVTLALVALVSLTPVAYAENNTSVVAPPNGATDTSGGLKPAGVTTNPQSNAIPKLENPIYASNVTDLLFDLVDVAIFVGTIFAVFAFIFIGFKFVMAQGSDSALSEAKQWFLYAVIGTAILIGSKFIVEVVKNTVTSAGLVKESVFNKPK